MAGSIRALLAALGLLVVSTAGAQDLSSLVARSGAEAWPAGKVPVGTAFFVSSAGHLLTAAHGVAGCPTVMVWPAGAAIGLAATVMGLDARLDLALLQAGVAPKAVARLTDVDSVLPGALLVTSTVDAGAQPASFRPVEVRADGYAREAGRPLLLELAGPFVPGMSGAPVVTADGLVAGMVVGRRAAPPGNGLAIAAQDITRFLRYFGVEVGGLAAEKTAAAPGAMVALVQCQSGEKRP